MKERPIIKTQYIFNAKTKLGDVAIHVSETEWDEGASVKLSGDPWAIDRLREGFDVAIGMYGTPVSIDFTSPMDINAGLHYLQSRRDIEGFELLFGYVPEESPRQVGDDGKTREIEIDEDI